jgi:electron transport complex protein RnfB
VQAKEPIEQPLTRREFMVGVGRGASLLALGGAVGALLVRWRRKDMVWQVDPWKCTQCERCATECVLDVSAVKCVHDFRMCGYCEFCFGFFKTDPVALDTGAENQMCPTGAILREFIEEPYFEYAIDEGLCNGCGKCVKGCSQFGNGSLYLQVRHDRCLNCNECAIAAACPANAFVRMPASAPYVIKSEGPEELERLIKLGKIWRYRM